jgi:hypothetical protein
MALITEQGPAENIWTCGAGNNRRLRKMHNEELLYNLYFSPNIISIIK